MLYMMLVGHKYESIVCLFSIVYEFWGGFQVEAGSMTVLAIGPARVPLIDSLTRHLKLL